MLVFTRDIGFGQNISEQHPEFLPLRFWAYTFGLTSAQSTLYDTRHQVRVFQCTEEALTLNPNLLTTRTAPLGVLQLTFQKEEHFRNIAPDTEPLLFSLLFDSFSQLGGDSLTSNRCVSIAGCSLTAVYNHNPEPRSPGTATPAPEFADPEDPDDDQDD